MERTSTIYEDCIDDESKLFPTYVDAGSPFLLWPDEDTKAYVWFQGKVEIPPGAIIGYRGVDHKELEAVEQTGVLPERKATAAVMRSRGEGVYAGIGPAGKEIGEAWMKTAVMNSGKTAGVVIIQNGDESLWGEMCWDEPDTNLSEMKHTKLQPGADFLIACMHEDLEAKRLPLTSRQIVIGTEAMGKVRASVYKKSAASPCSLM
mmetsp:Transcript_79112/g.178601  ORF Transcript_79112/g.178601 Transcript_79112/m.178601 type:complete len:205 (+) Transcript_79112:121-735(+)